MKKLVLSALLLLVAAVMLGTTTFAWFSMNKQVQVTGMQVTAQANSSLVIGLTPPPANSTTRTVSSTASGTLAPMHVEYANSAVAYSVVSTSFDVAESTGSPDAPTVPLAPQDGIHFYDETIYLASTSEEMTAESITAAVTSDSLEVFAPAISVLFFQNSVADANYLGQANVKGDQATLAITTIPVANGTNGVKLVMRIYVDGAANDGTNAYVRTSALPMSSVSLVVTFTAN